MNAQLLRHADLPPAKIQRASDAIERSAKPVDIGRLARALVDLARSQRSA